MSLPVLVCPSAVFTFGDGQTLAIRGLSRAEAIKARLIGNEDEQSIKSLELPEVDEVTLTEVFAISCAAKVTLIEAFNFHQTSPSEEVEKLVDQILALSGLKPSTGKADAEDSHSAKPTDSTT